MSLQSAVVVSALHSQAAHAFMGESLASPQSIAPMPRVCVQLAELTGVMLDHGYGEGDIRAILGGNASRLFPANPSKAKDAGKGSSAT